MGDEDLNSERPDAVNAEPPELVPDQGNTTATATRRHHVLDLPEVEAAIRAGHDLWPGWHLFPVQGKYPRKGFGWTTKATDDPQQRAQLADLPHDGWAVATGPSGLAVLDADRHKAEEDGLAALEAWGLPLSPVMGATPTGGGRHFWYANPTGVAGRNKLRLGLDLKAAGGYVVFAGPGRRLAWVSPWGPLPDLPSEVVAELRHPAPEPVRDLHPAPVVTGNPRGALRGAAGRVAAAVEGERNSVLNWAAFNAGRAALAAGAPVDQVTAVLVLAARACGLADAEALRTIRSGLGAA